MASEYLIILFILIDIIGPLFVHFLMSLHLNRIEQQSVHQNICYSQELTKHEHIDYLDQLNRNLITYV